MIHSFKSATTLEAYYIVEVTGNHLVALATTSSLLPIGVTKDEMKDTSSAIAVATAGERALVYFNDSVTVGGLVSADDSGRGILYAAATVAAGYVGVLLGAKVDATGTIAEILVCPGVGSTG